MRRRPREAIGPGGGRRSILMTRGTRSNDRRLPPYTRRDSARCAAAATHRGRSGGGGHRRPAGPEVVRPRPGRQHPVSSKCGAARDSGPLAASHRRAAHRQQRRPRPSVAGLAVPHGRASVLPSATATAAWSYGDPGCGCELQRAPPTSVPAEEPARRRRRRLRRHPSARQQIAISAVTPRPGPTACACSCSRKRSLRSFGRRSLSPLRHELRNGHIISSKEQSE